MNADGFRDVLLWRRGLLYAAISAPEENGSRRWDLMPDPLAIWRRDVVDVLGITDGVAFDGTNVVHAYDDTGDLVVRVGADEIAFVPGLGDRDGTNWAMGPVLVTKGKVPPGYRFAGSWVTGPTPRKAFAAPAKCAAAGYPSVKFTNLYFWGWPDIAFQGGKRRGTLLALRYCDRPSGMPRYFTNDLSEPAAILTLMPAGMRVVGPK